MISRVNGASIYTVFVSRRKFFALPQPSGVCCVQPYEIKKDEEALNANALIRKCQRGDRQAFDSLIRLYYDYVFGFLRRATGDQILAQDLTQEAFLKMIRSIETFDPGGSAAFGT